MSDDFFEPRPSHAAQPSRTLVEGHEVIVWSGALDARQLAWLERVLPWERATQDILVDEALAYRVAFAVIRGLGDAGITGWEPYVTLTNSAKPNDWHFDRPKGRARHKLFVYVNAVPEGGTIFGRRAQHLVPNAPGAAVLFPIALEHRGQVHAPGHVKRVVGLRVHVG